MDKLLIKRGSKRALEQLDPLQVGELFLAKDEERLYIGGPRGNISIPTQKDLDEKATKTELQQVSLAYKESYDTLDDLKNAYPNGDVYNHVVLADGMIYTYAKGQWVSTGVEANGAIEFMKAYEDLKVLGVGGRNLLRNTSDKNKTVSWSGWDYRLLTVSHVIDIGLNVGDPIVFKVYIEETNAPVRAFAEFQVDAGGVTRLIQKNGNIIDEGESGWSEVKFTISEEDVRDLKLFKVAIRNMNNSNATVTYRKAKMERGNKATDWTPAPEDIDAHPFVVELAETVYRSKQNKEEILEFMHVFTEENEEWVIDE